MSSLVLFLAVALAGVTSGLVWFVLDTIAHRGARRATAIELVEIVNAAERAADLLATANAHHHDIQGAVERIETDVRAVRDTVEEVRTS